MSNLVLNHGGNLVRVGEAINGFKAKYGQWPSELHISSECLDVLKNHHLTEDGFSRLSGFIKIIPANEDGIVALDSSDRKFDYGKEGWDLPRLEVGIGEILGFEE